MFAVATRRLRHIWHRPADLVLMIEITIWLGLAWLMLKFLPFRWTAMSLQPKIDKAKKPALIQIDFARLRCLIYAVSRRLPWRSVCFHRGIAAQRILCRLGIPANLHYGVLKQSDGFMGHVWVTVQNEIVVGGEEVQNCTLLMTFAAKEKPSA